jgi:uncharacterized RDD family membrane protein YckC
MAATAAPRVTLPYAGVATRAIALAVDAALANAIVLLAAGLVALVSSLVGDLRPHWLAELLAAAAWALFVGAYFTVFWATTGQTPGMRLMRLRVVTARGGPLPAGRALVRLVGLVLAIIPLFAGFLPVLVDERRRALPDFLAGTVVVHVPEDVTRGG